MWQTVSTVLGAAAAILFIRMLFLKKALRDIRKELEFTRKRNYNRQITIPLFDKDLSETAAEINRNLDFQKQLKFETERKERLLKQSVSDIAHDLRTPLTVIKGNLQLLEKEAPDPQELHYITVCSEKADFMKQMADGFFELALLESDSSPAELKRINATNVLMQFLADNEGVIRQSGLEPDVIFPEKTVFILADEAMLTRIMSNLLNNIIRYASHGFVVKLEENGTLSFKNSVKGIPPDPEQIFERTYRSDASRNGKGTGLGLYIVKLLAEKQHAEVSAVLENTDLSISVRFKTEQQLTYQ